MKRLRSVIKIIVIGFVTLVLILAIFPSRRSGSLKRANADSLDAYPGVCLGGWKNPGNAAGTPDASAGDTSFTDDNSAVLNQAQAQLFCGSFTSSDQSQTPTAVTLHFSWNVIFAAPAAPSAATDTDTSAWSDVLDATSTASSTPSVAGSSTPDDSSSGDTSSSSAPAAPPPAPTSTPAPAPAPTSAPAATSTPVPPPDSSGTSFLYKMISDPFALLVQKTFAQTASTTTVDTSTVDADTDTTDTSTADTSITDAFDDFIDVSYSLDGTTWTDLGQVSASEWQNYSVTIPVSSWSDIDKLQIQLSPDISPNEPVIYMDGMWLEVDYSQTLLGALQDGANGVVNAVTDISNTVNDAVNSATDAITSLLPTNSTAPADTTSNAPSPATPTAPPAPQHQYSFALQNAQSIKVGNLAWAPDGVAASGTATGMNSSTVPTVTLSASGTIQISGSCQPPYYTILIFANPGDYRSNPSLALYNQANKCVNGSFSQTIGDMDLPPQLASGTYYMMVANQGKVGAWAPYPELYPVTLNALSAATPSSSSQ